VNPVVISAAAGRLPGANLVPAARALAACRLCLVPGRLTPGRTVAGSWLSRTRCAGRETQAAGAVLAEVHGPDPLADPHRNLPFDT
jgi:hypothetical protein